ncbi:MAG: hypothetical protein OXF95_08210 [Rhodobacteraceae bacterium]|nr:hypothetical protein [Paracoccaceae bacterium]
MKITFETDNLQELCESEKELKKTHGKNNAKRIKTALALLKSAPNLSTVYNVKKFNLHQLSGTREGQFTLYLLDGKRLIFIPKSPVPRMSDGGFDVKKITEVKILEIVNYHGKKNRKK